MNISYTRLGEVEFRHEYFKNGRNSDLTVVPSEETNRFLKNGSILVRQIPGRLILLYRTEADETTALQPLKTPISFHFSLIASNPSFFYQITNLDTLSKKFESGNVPFFTNNPSNSSANENSPETLDFSLLDGSKSSLFSLSLNLQTSPSSVRIKVRNQYDEVISSGNYPNGSPLPDGFEYFPDDSGLFRIFFNLSPQPEGVYTFSLRNAADDTDLWVKKYWIGGFTSIRPSIGILQLNYVSSPANLYGTTEYYRLRFTALKSIWTYFIINGSNQVDFVSTDLEIEDGETLPVVPYEIYLFDQIGDSPNADILISNKQTVVFQSQQEIPFYQQPKLQLKLKKTGIDQPILSNLPNPSPGQLLKKNGDTYNSEIYVYI